jgi:hypothetical protein
MKGFFILLLVLARQTFSGEFTGGDKIDIVSPSIDKGEVTGADKPTITRPTTVEVK